MFDQSLLDILVCPACKAKVQVSPAHDSFKCTGCRRVYPVRDGIPIFLVDQATIAPE
jgi:uncharacterized protein